MGKELHVLMLEDNPLDAELMERELKRGGLMFRSLRVETKDTFVKEITDFAPDIIFADYRLPSFDGLSALSIAHEKNPDIPVIFVTGALGEEMAVEVMKKGATDYVLKDRMERLAPAVERALREVKERTERKLAQEKLAKLVESLKMTNEELEQFARITSHDLQEPLRMVTNYLSLLESQYKNRLDHEACEYIDFALHGARKMQSLIDYLVQYSRISTRGKPFEMTDCRVVFDSAISEISTLIRENGAIITQDTLPVVFGDGSQLGRIFSNLVSNAIKFRREEAPHIHIGVERKETEWVLSVKDNGIGFDMEHTIYLFKMFQRLHGAKYPGAGMGLAICKKIVERHGGRIWAESEPGKGSTFFFTLPIIGDGRT